MFEVLRHGGSRLMLAAGVVLLALLAGCAAKDTSNKTVVRFCFWGNFRDLSMWKTIAANFERANPDIKLKLEYITGDYGRKLPLMLVSGTASDIILMDDEYHPGFAARGYLEDLAPYIERDRAELRIDEFFPTSMESFNYRGFQGGLPWDGGAMLIYFNKDLFDEAGIPYPTDNWTWDDFREISKKLTVDKDRDGRIDQYGTNLLSGSLLTTEPMVWCFGAEVLNEDKSKFAMNSRKGVEAFQYITDLKWVDHSIAWAGEGDDVGTEAQLLTGRVGMVVAGTYMMLTLDGVKDGMRWGTAAMPRGPYGDRYTRVSWDGISINARTPYKEQAWRFIKFLLSDESQAEVGRSGRNLPIRPREALKYFMNAETNEDARRAIDAVQYGKLTPITPKYLEVDQATRPLMERMSLGKISPKDALKEMEINVNEVLVKELAKWGREKKKH
ncbi:MAG: sugar ABC transporter substrate-binding protein [Candidatus Hydrogenedentes bacterium]|nr:sugar ABC transporter substrate-binding protein [Candidatus Hydrogenedentota bacterium]